DRADRDVGPLGEKRGGQAVVAHFIDQLGTRIEHALHAGQTPALYGYPPERRTRSIAPRTLSLSCPTRGERVLTPPIHEGYSHLMRKGAGLAWRNWAGNQQAVAATVARPASTDDVVAVVKAAADAGRTVKPGGR